MISIRQLAKHFEKAAAKAEADLVVLTLVVAKAGEGLAKGYIGHLQGFAGTHTTVFPAWQPLAARTVEDKVRLGFGPPDYSPLERTGQAYASIEGVADGLTGAVVSSDPVMVYHEFGTSKMPPRETLSRAVAVLVPAINDGAGKIAIAALKPRGA